MKRYEIDSSGGVYVWSTGDWVRYSEIYEALAQRDRKISHLQTDLRQAQAENNLLQAKLNLAVAPLDKERTPGK